ncbi:MAG: T9SS type A sorting domain-containing protein [Balneolaceae bacterium]
MYHPSCGVRKILRTLFLNAVVLLYTAHATAQSGKTIEIKRSHSISLENRELTEPVEGILNVVAVMVEFQPDTNQFTSGNGTFEPGAIPWLEDPGTNVDALPHNREYFEAHLEFAGNYFETVSSGKFTISYRVLPDVIRLDKKMEEYSPIGINPSSEPLGELARDVWTLVEQLGGFDSTGLTSANTAFVIFHAGIGRDIELTGTLLDKTVQDIPSVYLSQRALGNLLDIPQFQGFPINEGELLVTNSLIIPRTQSRRGEDISGNTIVLPLSINGMLTAQLGSHIGLPDLFNTETGQSGIGRFGLMDGAGIFAFNGLFPPEMSAWEKQFLGWQESFEVNAESENSVQLPAAVLRGSNSLARVSLSRDEYFLLENRHRDIDGSGVTISIRKNDGTTVNQTFTNFDTDFILQLPGFDDLLEPGVVVDVSNFDFALPGGLDIGPDQMEGTDDDRELNGGILIWHIDESVIRQKIDQQRVNADINRKGVELMEADGAQDIGRPTDIGISQNNPNGSPFDFWWSGNDASVILPGGRIISLFENRFGPDTTPNNNSKAGAPSPFEIFDFSDNLPVASFSIRPVSPFSDIYELIATETDTMFDFFTFKDDPFHSAYPLASIPSNSDESPFILIPGNSGVRYYNINESEFENSKSIFSNPVQQPLLFDFNNMVAVAEKPKIPPLRSGLTFYRFSDNEITAEWQLPIQSNNGFISTINNQMVLVDHTTIQLDPFSQTVSVPFNNPIQFSDRINEFQSSVVGNQLLIHAGQLDLTQTVPFTIPDGFTRIHTGVLQLTSSNTGFYLLGPEHLFIYVSERNFEPFPLIENIRFDWPALTDLSGDGRIDFIYVDETNNKLNAKTQNASTLDHFPINAPVGTIFTGTPLIADISGDGIPEILITGLDGFSMNIHAYSTDGNRVEGFPLSVGAIINENYQPINPVITGSSLIAVSPRGDLKEWILPSLGDVFWGGKYGNSTNNKITGRVQSELVLLPENTVLNKDETYNWPNPARDETNLRFQTNSAGEIHIKITTMSGRLIYDRTVQSAGGAPEEIVIDTSSWSSGGYFALVKAKVDGREDHKVVRIAITK